MKLAWFGGPNHTALVRLCFINGRGATKHLRLKPNSKTNKGDFLYDEITKKYVTDERAGFIAHRKQSHIKTRVMDLNLSLPNFLWT